MYIVSKSCMENKLFLFAAGKNEVLKWAFDIRRYDMMLYEEDSENPSFGSCLKSNFNFIIYLFNLRVAPTSFNPEDHHWTQYQNTDQNQIIDPEWRWFYLNCDILQWRYIYARTSELIPWPKRLFGPLTRWIQFIHNGRWFVEIS